MQEIDSYVELVDLEITSNLDAVPRIAPSPSLVPTAQLAVDVPAQPARISFHLNLRTWLLEGET